MSFETIVAVRIVKHTKSGYNIIKFTYATNITNPKSEYG